MKFCGQCAAPLGLTCPSCGAANPPGNNFCGRCAASLTEVAQAPTATSRLLTSRAAIEGERKHVTVLFADLKGSMELLADRDPEEARQILDEVLTRMMQAVHDYGGTVNQAMGDGIMALFGAPVAQEDHALRACYAALRMQEQIARHADEVFLARGLRVQIRVGLNSGEVVVRSIGSDLHTDYTAVGQVTHLAARMEQIAAPGTIMLTPATLALAAGRITVEPRGPVEVKGLSAPIDVYELTGANRARTRLEAAALRGLTPFVGRDDEIGALHRALERAGAGRGQLVAVVGEPGIGKSRLLHEFSRGERPPGWLVLDTALVPYGKATAYMPVVDLLKRYFGLDSRDTPQTIEHTIAQRLRALDLAPDSMLAPFRALLDLPVDDLAWTALDHRQRLQRILDAVRGLLLRQSEETPLLLVFEDVHWIDSGTQAVLDALVSGLAEARVLLLVSYRPEYRHAWHAAPFYTEIRVAPLDGDNAEAILGTLLGSSHQLDPLKRMLSERTRGNPMFLEESVHSLVETGALAGERRGYRLARHVTAIQVPATVQAVLAERIDRLPDTDKALLQSAAVIGQDVPFSILQAVAGLLEDALIRGIANLEAADFLYETSLGLDRQYSFKHALTHDVAYGSLLRDRRRRLHAAIVAAIETHHADRLTEHVEQLAHHAINAGLDAPAVRYLLAAGQKATARSALGEAVGCFEKGLELLGKLPEHPERDRQELELYTAFGRVLRLTRGYAAPEVEHAFGRARELCEHVRDFPQLGVVLQGQWTFYLLKAQYPTARALGEQLTALAERTGDPLLAAVSHVASGMTELYVGGLLTTRHHLERGLALSRSQDFRARALREIGFNPEVACLAYLARALWALGYPDQALARAREAVVQARLSGTVLDMAAALGMRTSIHHIRREVDETREACDQAVAYASEHGITYWVAQGQLHRSWVRAIEPTAVDRRAGLAEIRDRLEQYRAIGTVLGLTWFLTFMAEICVVSGQPAEGLAVLDEAIAHVEKTGERYHEPDIDILRAELLLMQGSAGAREEAEACFRHALDVARAQSARMLELRAALGLARLLARQDDRKSAHALVAPIYQWFTEGFETPDLRDARALLAATASD
jgi:class 3 adenylate cyclase/predicted ATPase